MARLFLCLLEALLHGSHSKEVNANTYTKTEFLPVK